MPLTIPAFDQYQQPLIPLRGLWNVAPKEGDLYVNAEIDWLVTTKSNAVQFSLSGNSPVAISQIVAVAIDNSRSGADVQLVFADSGFALTCPAHNQVIAPVFTQGLMFYASAPAALAGDVTMLQIFNSNPPPIPIAPSEAQNHANVSGVPLTNGSTVIVPAGVNGTLNTLSVTISVAAGAAAQSAAVNLYDGSGKLIWAGNPAVAANSVVSIPYNLVGLALRFVNGLNLVVSSSSLTGGYIVVNAYYSTP
jgi:hypothetical protein